MKKYISLLLVIIWMIFIFIMSSFSAGDSSNQSGFIVNIICNLFNIANTELITVIIRKLAHFTEYFILGILTYNCIKNYQKPYYISIIICFLYAISDEIHQIFVPGRSMKITDILIDTIGAIVAIQILKKKKTDSKQVTIYLFF